MKEKRPYIGLAIILIKDDRQVLLGKRKGSHGAGTWSLPGGHLEYMESHEDCTKRELSEETGLTDKDYELIDFVPSAITNDFFPFEKKHYTTLWMRARYLNGEPRVTEKNRCEKWEWFGWGFDKMPSRLFIPLKNLLNMGYDPFEKPPVMRY